MQCLCRCCGSVRAARRRSVTRFVSSAHRVRSSRGPARSRSTEVCRARAAARSAGQWLGAARRCLPSPPLPALSTLHPQAARSCLGFTSSQKPPLPAPPEEALHPPFFFSAKPFAAPPFLPPPPTAFSSRASLRPPLPPPPPSGAAPMLAPRRKGRARAQAERARALPQLSRRGPAPLQIAPPSSSGGSRGGRREEGTRAERRRDRRAEGSIRWSRPAGGRRARVMLNGAAG